MRSWRGAWGAQSQELMKTCPGSRTLLVLLVYSLQGKYDVGKGDFKLLP